MAYRELLLVGKSRIHQFCSGIIVEQDILICPARIGRIEIGSVLAHADAVPPTVGHKCELSGLSCNAGIGL